MKKLFLVLFALLCSAALTMPVFADIALSPLEELYFSDSMPYILLGIGVLTAGAVLFFLLRNRRK